jgi:hypothetical protein
MQTLERCIDSDESTNLQVLASTLKKRIMLECTSVLQPF